MTKARDIADFKFEDIVDTGTEGTKVASGTTAQRGSTTGQIRFNTTTSLAEYYTGTAFKPIDSPPTVSSIDDTEVDSAGGGNQTIVVTGSNFQSGATVTFLGNAGTNFNASTVTVNSDTQITAVAPKSSFLNAQEPYGVKVSNTNGLSGTLASQINVDNSPAWQTASGTIYTGNDITDVSVTVSATDPEGDTVAYSETTSVLSGAGLSLNSSTGAITGTPTGVGSNTTYTFTLRATAGGKTADRQFSIVITNAVVTTFSYTGSDQTFTVPSGVSSFTAYMWGAGGAAGYNYSGGGGGGRHNVTGGSGGFTTGTVATSAGTVYKLVVGGRGEATDVVNGNGNYAYGGGGRSRVSSHAGIGGGGGGYSGIFLTSVAHGNSVLIAGGGAGANGGIDPQNVDYSGNGGGASGQDGGLNSVAGHTAGGNGKGGTQSAGGVKGNHGSGYANEATDGSALQGGNSAHMSGAAGGGYYGGGGGSHTGSNGGSGSGGGSGYIGHSSVSNGTTTGSTHTNMTGDKLPPQTSHTYYSSGIAVGGNQAHGGHGKVVIVY
jgi:hypothetical protein